MSDVRRRLSKLERWSPPVSGLRPFTEDERKLTFALWRIPGYLTLLLNSEQVLAFRGVCVDVSTPMGPSWEDASDADRIARLCACDKIERAQDRLIIERADQDPEFRELVRHARPELLRKGAAEEPGEKEAAAEAPVAAGCVLADVKR